MNTFNRPRLYLALSLALFSLALLTSMGQVRSANEARAAMIAPHVLRFHIMANSDSDADQNVKLEIRSLVLDYLRENLVPDTDKKDTENWLIDHQTDIEAIANRHLAQNHFQYDAHLELTNCYFPTRYYDGLTFPCGNYDAARITLGSGNGHNWWCVLYPRYCFVDEAYETQKENSAAGVKGNIPLQRQTTDQDGIPFPEERRPAVKFSIKFLSFFNPH